MRRHGIAPTALALAIALLSAPAAQSASKSWACAVSYWDYEDCWLPFGLPGPADQVVVDSVGGGDTVLRFDEMTDVRSVQSLLIKSSTQRAVRFELSGGSLTTVTSIVDYGPGALFSQMGGTHRSAYLLVRGAYELSGGALKVDSNTEIGELETVFGFGYLLQSGGSVSTVGLDLGGNYGKGFYGLTAGSLTATHVRVGYISQGEFQQTGGTSVAQDLTLGIYRDGTFALSGGTLTMGSVVVSDRVRSDFYQSGGSHTSNSLVLGHQLGSEGSYQMTGGTLSTVSVNVGNLGVGSFQHSGGTHLVDDNMRIGSSGRYELSGGGVLQMAGNGSIDNHGVFAQTGGRFVGVLDNHGSFVYGAVGGAAPEFAGRLLNSGTVTLNVNGSFADGMQNDGSFEALVTGRSLALDGAGLENNGSIVMAGGVLQGSGVLVNHGTLSGHGRIGGSGAFLNYGVVSQGSAPLVLANTGGHVNYGAWMISAPSDLQLAGSSIVLNNYGVVTLQGGKVSGSGAFNNAAGGVVSGSGSIGARFTNGGTLALANGDRVSVGGVFGNTGLIDLGGSSALLSGNMLVNAGLVAGRGRIANAVDNRAGGRIQADGGVLALAGTVQNAGLLVAEAGGTLLVQGSLASQTGTVQLNGGTFDSGGSDFRNDGVIGGHGTLRGSVIDNAGQMQFSAGSTQVHGTVDNLEGGRIIVSGTGVATFYGNVMAHAGSELRVSTDSAAVFFGTVSQANGAAFTGEGTRYFEGGLSVGDSPGAGGAEGSVVFGSGNLYRAEIGGLAAGSGFDHFAVGDQLSLGGTLQLSWWGGFEAQAGQRFDLFDWGRVSGTFAAIDLAAAALDPGLRWDTSRLYLDGSVGVAAVPEPGTWALMLGGIAAVGRLVHRRRSAAA